MGRRLFLELTAQENHFRDETVKLLTIQDITQRREMEELREEFLKMVSHDLRSPLTAIQLTHELLLSNGYGQLPDKARDKLMRAEKSSARLLKLIIIARVKAHLRRVDGKFSSSDSLQALGIILDLAGHRASKDGEEIKLLPLTIL